MNNLNRMVYQKDAYFPDCIYGLINTPVKIVTDDMDDIIAEHELVLHRLIKGSQFCILPDTTQEVFSEKPGLINTIAIDFFKD